MPAVFVYATAASRQEAEAIGRRMVEDRLAACANVLGDIRSFYWWQGKLEESGEAAVIMKTRQDLVEPLTRAVKALHSYECPCVVALPVIGGNPDFLAWIEAETKP